MTTSRVFLQPFSVDDLLALVDGVPQAEARMGVRIAQGLRDFFVSGDVSPGWLERIQSVGASDPWVHGFAVVQRDAATAVGTAGFKGPPDADGVVEIAYGIVPSCEGRGYATEAASAVVAFAFSDPRVKTIRAHTLPTANASTRVLSKCLFTHVGEFVDPDDGPVWRWERTKQSG